MVSTASRTKVFSYVTADKADLYTAVMRAFMEARERFEIHLRPADVREALLERGAPLADEVALDAALRQLCSWGNLELHPDTADVATVEEFLRQRFLYQLTPDGEAAERALAVFHETVGRPGELQAAALSDIRSQLAELLGLAERADPDAAKTWLAMEALRRRFEELAAQAQRFMNSVQRAIDLRGLGEDAFVQYKQLLIHYLERFIGELVDASADITARIERIEGHGVARLLERAARHEVADVFATDAAEARAAFAAAADRWRLRWTGLRAWFLGRGDHPAQAEVLRARARSACTALVAALAGIHDRRTQRSDRSADYRALARWFADAPSDRDAHRLWRAAFALAPARHLFVDDETLAAREAEPEPAVTSWLTARPIRVAPRFRATGSHARRGRPAAVIDRSADRAFLEDLAHEEVAVLAAARRALATGARLRLSELSELSDERFEVLLDLLGEALSARIDPGETVEATSSDGSLHVTLEPVRDGSLASIRTSSGRLTGPDHFVTIRDAFEPQAAGQPLPEAAE
jgi:uncharacterized protein (TIGR02677 family)